MAEETAGQAGVQSTESQVTAPSVGAGDVPSIGTKLHSPTTGQAALRTAIADPIASPGQGEEPPAKTTEPQQTPPAQTQQTPAAKWEPAHENWIKSKGLDLTKFDPANDAHVQLVKNALSAESEMTKAKQAAKTQQQPPAPVPQQHPAAPKEMSPLDEFEAIYNYEKKSLLDTLGVTEAQLYEDRPDILRTFENKYVFGRQRAWEETQEWKAQKAHREATKKSEEEKFASEMSRLNQSMENNFVVVRSKNPQFDQVFAESGFDKLFDVLDKTYALPKQFILSDPSILNLFVSAAEALAYQKQEPARREAWQKEYESRVAKAKGAQLPPAAANDQSTQQTRTIPQNAHWSKRMDSAVVKG